MISHVTKQFSALYRRLPIHVQQQADEAYEQFKHDPNHPSLHFKPVQQMPGVFSARVSGNWRVLGRVRNGEIYQDRAKYPLLLALIFTQIFLLPYCQE